MLTRPIRVILPDGTKYLAQGGTETREVPEGESQDKILSDIREMLGTNLHDELVFYNDKTRRYIIARFGEIPNLIGDLHKKGEKVGLVDEPDYRLVYVNDEADEYDIRKVRIVGLPDEDHDLAVKIGEEFWSECLWGGIDSGDFADAMEEIKEEFPAVEVHDVRFEKVEGGKKIDVTLIVKRKPKGVVVDGLDEGDPLYKKIREEFGERYFDTYVNEYGIRIPETSALEAFIEKEIAAADDFYIFQWYTEFEGKPRVMPNLHGSPTVRIRRFSALDQMHIDVGPEAEVVETFFKRPLTKKAVAEGMARLHDYFAAKGKIVHVVSSGERIAAADGSLFLAIIYDTKDAPREIVINGDLPIGAERVREIFGEPANGVAYTNPEIEKGMDALLDFLKKRYVPAPLREGESPMEVRDGKLFINLRMARIKEYDIGIFGKKDIDKVVISRQFKGRPGDFFDKEEFREGVDRVFMTDQFNDINPSYVQSDEGEIVPVIYAEPAGHRMFGAAAGYGPEGVAGQVQAGVTRLREEEHISVGIMGSSVHQGLGVTFMDPWYFGNGRSLSLSAFGEHWAWGKADEESGKTSTEHSLTVGGGGEFGFPLGGAFSPWRLYNGLNLSYTYFSADRPEGTTDIPVLFNPYATIGYFQRRRRAAVTLSGNFGFLNYPEWRVEVARTYTPLPDTPIGAIDLEIGAAAGTKIAADDLPRFARYNIFNTPGIYGQSIIDDDTGLYFDNAWAKLKWAYKKYVAIELGITAGGIGNSADDMQNIGLGGGVCFPMAGMLCLESGYMFDLRDGDGHPGFMIRFGKQ